MLPHLSLLLLLLLASPSPHVSSPLPTVAVAHAANSTIFLVCALVLDRDASTADTLTLSCTEFPSRRVHTYPFGNTHYAGVAAGDGFLCGLTSPSSNSSSMLWWDFSNATAPPKRVYHGEPLEDLASGDTHVCGLLGTTRRIVCWRWRSLRCNPPGDIEYRDLAVGDGFLCGLLPSGKIRCFGCSSSVSGSVVGNEPDGNYTVVAAGDDHACALTAGDQQLHCWGPGWPELTGEAADLQYHAIALGRNRTCAIQANGTAACWGHGEFRLPDSLEREELLSIAAKGAVFCGVRTRDYALVCWGNATLDAHPVVFPRVLPGPCKPSCPCRSILGSASLCPSGTSICAFCDLRKIQIPSPPSITPHDNTTTSNTTNADEHNGKRVIFILMGAIGFGMVILTLTVFLVSSGKCCCGMDVHVDSPRTPPPAADGGGDSSLVAKGHSTTVEEFPLELLHAITGGFSEVHRIGSGSFGAVYLATLDDGRHVAIKRAEPFPSRSPSAAVKHRAFLSELTLLSRVNHRNLVRLLGFCADGTELALVYEHMPNGTLHDHLHRGVPSSPLSAWAPRLRVALDAARGLEYLHRFAVPPIIHRDIKPSNILLDAAWTAKVADFGLCLVGDEIRTSHVSFPTAGTVGYMDPEYYRTGGLTAKSDVYSFGVVLLELLTGRKAIHRRGSYGGEPCNVVEFAVPRIAADELPEVLDPALPLPRPCEIEAVQQVGYLAADCVSYEGRRRPDMAEVVDELQRAVAACLGTDVAAAPVALTRSLTSHSV